MARASTSFICQSCGTAHPRWQGRCDGCGAWNTLAEEAPAAAEATHAASLAAQPRRRAKSLDILNLSEAGSRQHPRLATGIGELDRATGGGLVPGAAVLIGGDPGIGKSTLLLQAAAALARTGAACLYITGEESTAQVGGRAARLALADAPVRLAAASSVRDIAGAIKELKPAVAVIDSIQTMFVDTLDAAPGTVGQVRAAAHELTRLAKATGTVVLFVGHVTKEGQIAGPRVLEHMVDTVLYFEGERSHQFRVLRAVKNRFGPTDEIGVFEMASAGLQEVPNPSALFLAQRQGGAAGSAVLAALEGTRPVLVEVQALVAPSPFGTPRRAVIGWDGARLAMLAAVLERSLGLSLAGQDIFLNIAGGIRVAEPAADLAVAAALISAQRGTPLPEGAVFFGEVGLSGEVRAVAQADVRLREAAKLGFTRAVVPVRAKKAEAPPPGLALTEVADLAALEDAAG
ncbi:MAG TPA: DNA repair protein RadA [Rhodospirillaceae bacterium]|jgi:DNA repair protein RadA/Sms|nr:DNA repair protein RadA [Alphaproteobacteria bacterium]HBH26022.1 DNA repair protein RadA [Rhodospirillaceae bacterium]